MGWKGRGWLLLAAPLERPLARGCERWCRLVARHPWPFILLPVLSTALLSTGLFLHFRVVRGVNYLYSALDAPWKEEHRVFVDNWASQDQRFYPGRDALLRPGLFVIVTARDNGSVLRPAPARQLVQLIDWIRTVPLEWPSELDNPQGRGGSHRFFTFADVCLQFPSGQCFGNQNAQMLAKMFIGKSIPNVTFPDFRLPSAFNLTSSTTEPMDLSAQLGGVQLWPADGRRLLRSARAWMLSFPLRQRPKKTVGKLSNHFELSLADLLRHRPHSPSTSIAADFDDSAASSSQHSPAFPLLQLAHYHSGTFDRELAENGVQLAPKFGATFALLVLFAVLCTLDWMWLPLGRQRGGGMEGGSADEPWPSGTGNQAKQQPSPSTQTTTPAAGLWMPVPDWSKSKPLLGLCGVASTLMAIASATGLLLWAGVTFVDMCSVMPFLSLTIGIDDTFLMLAAWRATSPALPVETRLEQAMRHAAVSIAITSLTDALAFLIGSIAPLPAVTYFCYYSSLAILFIFVHFMTIFVAVLALQGRREARGRHCLFPCRVQVPEKEAPFSLCTALLNTGSPAATAGTNNIFSGTVIPPKDGQGPIHWSQRLIGHLYVPLLTHWAVQLGAALSLAAFGLLAVAGIQQLSVGFKLIDIISYDQQARQFLLLREDYFPEDVQRLDLAVMRPPNMGRPGERFAFLAALEELERVSECTGRPEASQFWWRQWRREVWANGHGEDFERMDLGEEAFARALGPFLRANARFDYDLLWREQGEKGAEEVDDDPVPGRAEVDDDPVPAGRQLRAFRLSVQMAHFGDDDQLRLCAHKIREICHKYSQQYGLFSYSPLWNLADQFEIIWPQTMQDLYISVAVMALISLLVIPRPFCSVVVGLNILSIGFGTIGAMPFWGVNLDATSMITIAMSVGFSVDFAAHITYSYILVAERHRHGQMQVPAGIFNKATPLQCVEGALMAVGWPISQASASVLLGIWPLATVHTHIIQTCFKTVFLVIVFGWLHALVFLPLALMNVHRLYHWLSAGWRRWKKRRQRQPRPTTGRRVNRKVFAVNNGCEKTFG